MISMQYSNFNEADKLIYFEAATNASLQLLISEELKTIEEQILLLDKRDEESVEDFIRRFQKLQINRTILLEFVDINQTVITEIKNLPK